MLNQTWFVPQEGDWVKGTTAEDAMFRGYVEAVQPEKAVVTVKVTQSDLDRIIGQSIEVSSRRVEGLPEETHQEAGHLWNWIDLALNVRDEDWFNALTRELGKRQTDSTGHATAASVPYRNQRIT